MVSLFIICKSKEGKGEANMRSLQALKLFAFVPLAALALVCTSCDKAPTPGRSGGGAGGAKAEPAAATVRVGSYNIRTQNGDRNTPNAWDARKADMVELMRRIDFDVVGLQEVCPDQAAYR